jgi:ADP-ribose pyrophosphatase YjhB (NUDIX family)
MENSETVAEAALRETQEEANARIELDDMFTVISVPQVSQVHVVYLARLLDMDFSAGEETLEARLFAEHEIPWEDIAFKTITMTLRHYFEDRRTGAFRFHATDVPPP